MNKNPSNLSCAVDVLITIERKKLFQSTMQVKLTDCESTHFTCRLKLQSHKIYCTTKKETANKFIVNKISKTGSFIILRFF